MKQIVKLTESDLHNLIENAVRKYLNECRFSPEQLDDFYEGKENEKASINEIGNSKKGQKWLGMAARNVRGKAMDAMRNGDFETAEKFNKRQRDIDAKAMENDNIEDRLGYGEGWLEQSNRISSLKNEESSFQNNQNYSHFAVNKTTNKIVNGWDYAEYDPEELRQFKRDFFTQDLIDYDLDPKQYKIVTGKYLLRQGIDPNDNNNWANS